ncbi:MAG: DUF2931 family protein [Tannerellaceae bacterium]|nr:DUF2931 family protein [Tannerellaceae bacterium]MCD8177522.1 DUF2931 family protein [Tannerellaceae bacterium]
MERTRQYQYHRQPGQKAPYRLVVHWISYIEEKLYKGVFDLPTEKMTELFREEYIDFRRNKERCDYIVVGLAPEGMVVVWLWSPNKCVEVGCYWAEESDAYTIRQIAPGSKTVHDNKTLADYAHTLWTKKADLVENFNKNGLGNKIWDTYREWFTYRVVTEYIDGATGITDYIRTDFYNAEIDCFKEESLQTIYNFRQWPRMKFLNVVWSDKEDIYEVNIDFDEEEVFRHFATMFPEGEDTQAEMVVQIGPDNLHINLLLRNTADPTKEVIFHNADIKVYKLRYSTVGEHISVLNPKK